LKFSSSKVEWIEQAMGPLLKISFFILTAPFIIPYSAAKYFR